MFLVQNIYFPYNTIKYFEYGQDLAEGSLAEWSKALVLGTSPKGRGFESHSCQILLNYSFLQARRNIKSRSIFSKFVTCVHAGNISIS